MKIRVYNEGDTVRITKLLNGEEQEMFRGITKGEAVEVEVIPTVSCVGTKFKQED